MKRLSTQLFNPLLFWLLIKPYIFPFPVGISVDQITDGAEDKVKGLNFCRRLKREPLKIRLLIDDWSIITQWPIVVKNATLLLSKHKLYPKFQFSEKFKIMNLNFWAKNQRFFLEFKSQIYCDNLNFCAKSRDFAKVLLQQKLKIVGF